MPLPKTDEEIQNGWSPKQWEYFHWYEESKQAIRDTMKVSAEWNAHRKLIRKAWPNPDDAEGYQEWAYEWLGRFIRRKHYKMSAREFGELIYQTDFLNNDQVGAIVQAMDIYDMPFVTIGETDFGGVLTGYGFTLSPRYLEPSQRVSGHGVTDDMILAMNIDVPYPPSRSTSVHSNEGTSTRSRGSSYSMPSVEHTHPRPRPRAPSATSAVHQARGEIDPNHFVFAQLGVLHVYSKDWEQAQARGPSGMFQDTWWTNGFAIVVRLSEKGVPGAVYALYSHDQQPGLKDDDDDNDDYDNYDDVEDSPEAANHIPGHLHPRSNEEFRLAKVADSLTELGDHNKRFSFIPITLNEDPIVRVKLWESKVNYELKDGEKVWDWYIAPNHGTWKEPTKQQELVNSLQDLKVDE
ncbi:hypothetical protein ACHAPU_005987 [Fusarium lateritium]